MIPGTVIRLHDGRLGTVVYHNLDGYGIIWGNLPDIDPDDLPEPEAMLREPYPSAEYECVGKDYVLYSGPIPRGRFDSRFAIPQPTGEEE